MMRPSISTIGMAFALLISFAFTSTPCLAKCNDICQAKCKLQWQSAFASRAECVKVWSRRNGPTGWGCGVRGGPFVPCSD